MRTVSFYDSDGQTLVGTGLVEGLPPVLRASDGHVYMLSEVKDASPLRRYMRIDVPRVHLTLHVKAT